MAILKQASAAAKRDFSQLRLTWFGGATIAPDEKTLKPRLRDDFLKKSGLYGTPKVFEKKIKALIDAGCTYFLFDTRGIPDDGEIELMIDVTRKFA